jgi:hypothetical protein
MVLPVVGTDAKVGGSMIARAGKDKITFFALRKSLKNRLPREQFEP